MQADRATAGLGGTAVLVAVAFAPGHLTMREVVFLVLAAVVLLATFAPILPVLHRIPKIGARRVSLVLSWEHVGGNGNEGSGDLVLTHVGGHNAEPRVLRLGFVNKDRRVHRMLVNVLVPEAVELEACDYAGGPSDRGKAMPLTMVDGVPMRFRADQDVDLTGALLMHYKLSFPDVTALGTDFRIRVQYSSDDLYGGERVLDRTVRLVDKGATPPAPTPVPDSASKSTETGS
jgi:hypothetical protein